jgi:hypothetical protein
MSWFILVNALAPPFHIIDNFHPANIDQPSNTMYHPLTIISTFVVAGLASQAGDARIHLQRSTPPYCADGSDLQCCTGAPDLGGQPVSTIASLACFDLTPATEVCVLGMYPPSDSAKDSLSRV